MKRLFAHQKTAVNRWAVFAGLFAAGAVIGTLASLAALGKAGQSYENMLKSSATYPSREHRGMCEVLVCPGGQIFQTCAHSSGVSVPVAYFYDPCLAVSDAVESPTPSPTQTVAPSPTPTTRPTTPARKGSR